MTDADKSLTARSLPGYTRSLTGEQFSDPNGEIDLRDEMNGLLYGDGDEISRGRWIAAWVADPTLRVPGFNVSAGHYDETRQSADYLHSGFIHTESVVKARISFTGGQEDMANWGRITANTAWIYVAYDVFPNPKVAMLSEIWELNLNNDGTIIYEDENITPYLARWNIRLAWAFREDGGKTQYWRLHCERQEI